jgi:23S rRNA (guanosine2251-2'-O)-methyltransferase
MQHHRHRHQKKQEEGFIYGIRPIQEALDAGREIEKILVQRDIRSEGIRGIMHLAGNAGIPVQKVPAEKLNFLTQGNHQGVVAFMSLIEYRSLDSIIMDVFDSGKSPLLVMLDRITDVRNFGAIARSAECAGANALIIPSRGSALINADAVKTSAGALNNIPVHRSPNLKDTLQYLKDSGIMVAAVTEYGKKNYDQADLSRPLVLVLGSEEDGISVEYLRLCDEKLRIPMSGTTASLNVSVAAGIVLFEAGRQRRNSGEL